MALVEELSLYRDTTELLNKLYVLTQMFPRFFRYGLGIRMTDLVLDMLSLIYRANSSYEKLEPLRLFLDKFQMLRTLFRVCVEQKIITPRQYAMYALIMDRIGKQATAWKKYCEKGKAKTE